MKTHSLVLIMSLCFILLSGCVTTGSNTNTLNSKASTLQPTSTMSGDVAEQVHKMF